MNPLVPDRIESLSNVERWFADARTVIDQPGGYLERLVDVTWATSWFVAQRAAGLPVTIAHLLVRAAAIALARKPELHQTIGGYRILTPGTVDIGLSVVESASYLPVVIEAVDEKPLPVLVPAIDGAVAAAREAETRTLARLRWLSWLAPFGFLRRLLLRWAQKTFRFRRKVAGTFQVSFTPLADLVVPLRFYSGSALAAGRVRDLVVAVDGRLEIRQVVTLVLVVDHVAMDGVRCATLLNEIAAILEGEDLAREVPSHRNGVHPKHSIPQSTRPLS
jgi:hypothetical protein